MRIVNRAFRDYYDHVGSWGEAESYQKLVYDRGLELKETDLLVACTTNSDLLQLEMRDEIPLPTAMWYPIALRYKSFGIIRDYQELAKLLVIGDIGYLITGKQFPTAVYEDGEWLPAKHQSYLGHRITYPEYQDEFAKFSPRELQLLGLKKDEKYSAGVESGAYAQLTKKVGAPVYMIRSVFGVGNQYRLMIERRVPVLASIVGFPGAVSAAAVYQRIEHTLANILRENPDTVPPVTVADRDRLQQRGFDVKQSFRHRK